MEPKRKLFIYDRREVGILILLGVGVALFAFTLGLHLGKQVNPAGEHAAEPNSEAAATGENAAGEGEHDHAAVAPTGEHAGEPVAGAEVAAPARSDVSKEVKNVPGAIEDTLDQTLRDEVSQTGLKVATPKPLKLPKETRAALERDGSVKESAKERVSAPKGATLPTESEAPAATAKQASRKAFVGKTGVRGIRERSAGCDFGPDFWNH